MKKTRHQQRPGLHDMLQLGDFAMHPLHQCILNLEETITEMILRGMFLPMLKNEMFSFQSKGYFGKRSLYTSSSQVVLTPENHQVNRSTGSPRGKLLPHRMDGFHRSQHLMGLIHCGLCLFHFIVKVCLGEARNVTKTPTTVEMVFLPTCSVNSLLIPSTPPDFWLCLFAARQICYSVLRCAKKSNGMTASLDPAKIVKHSF